MHSLKKMLTAMVLAGVCVMMTGGAGLWAQSDQPAKGQSARMQRPNFQRLDPQQMEQRADQMIQQTLKVSDEEWAVIGPRVREVRTLARQAGGGRGMRRMAGGGRFGNQPANFQDQNDPSSQALAALQKTLQQENPSNAQLQQQMTELREAKAAANVQLAKAQAELRELLSVRQEAVLVTMGILN
jgi:hypothetical protein